MNNNILRKISANKHNYRYIAVCVFMVAAGVIYSISRLVESGSTGVYEYNVSESTADGSAYVMTEPTTQDRSIYAYVCGAVANPDVYRLDEGTRIYEAIELAGGCIDGADMTSLNLADKIADGQKVYVPMEGEAVTVSSGNVSDAAGSKININTATVSELTSLPGIGESRANDIVNYRTKNGFFGTIEDIKNVSGIKDAAFEKIKDYIKV